MKLERLGKYRIVAKIGQGGMGEVYRAHDPVLGRDVAIKTMTTEAGVESDLRRRFHREAQSAARLNHSNIVTVFDFGEDQGRMYIAMELLEGSDLKEVITEHKPLSLAAKLALMVQICDGLAFAHARDIVHRDLKPGNIHVLRNGQVKVMDFGLARVSSSDMTRAGMMLGTPNYMSPEQVRGQTATARSDVFALGAVFYELLSGRKAFDADSLTGVLYQVMQAEPEPLDRLDPALPPAICAVVRKSLSRDPASRYAHAGELLESLCEAQAAAGLSAPATPSPRGLDVEETRTVTPPSPTLAEGAPTRVVPSPRGAVVRPPARPAVGRPAATRTAISVAGLTALLLGAGVVAWRLLYGSPPAESDSAAPPSARAMSATRPQSGLVQATQPPATIPPVTRPPAPSVEDARRSLQAKDYARAADTAQRILAAEPADAGARAVLEQAQRSQRAVATALAEARNGLQAGDGERASKALEALLSLAPQHPELPGLSARLNDLLRSQADEARRALERARRQPPAGVPPAVTPPPATAPPATLAASPPATFPPAQTEAASRQAIRGVLDEFRAAFERRDVDALRAVQPGVDYEFMKRTFASVTGYTVRIDVGDVKVQGDTATASCLVTYNPVPKPAGKTKPIPTVFHLRRSGQLWLIERLERN